MRFIQVDTRRYAQFERLADEAGLVHAFSTRPGDVGPRNVRDGATQRGTMAGDWGLGPKSVCYCEQVHGSKLCAIAEPTAGPLAGCDGVATALRGVPLMTFSADCPLVLIYDPTRFVVGLVHASWRCTVAALTAEMVALMEREFGCEAAGLRAGIGPGAGPCCYEVRADVYAAAAELPARDRVFHHRSGRLFFDLWEANRQQLMAAGVPESQIESAGVCTMCSQDVFYSYRREGPGCGHFGLMAALTERGS